MPLRVTPTAMGESPAGRAATGPSNPSRTSREARKTACPERRIGFEPDTDLVVPALDDSTIRDAAVGSGFRVRARDRDRGRGRDRGRDRDRDRIHRVETQWKKRGYRLPDFGTRRIVPPRRAANFIAGTRDSGGLLQEFGINRDSHGTSPERDVTTMVMAIRGGEALLASGLDHFKFFRPRFFRLPRSWR